LVDLPAQDLRFHNSGAHSTLVELYSSEGCSSCPPAEEWVSTLKDSPRLWKDLFPVVFHVDYWDGAGWRDRFAHASYTQRQRDYAARLGQDSVYTPEFVVGGREWRAWFNGGREPEAAQSTSGELTLSVKDGGREVETTYTGNNRATVSHYALLGVGLVSNVRGGENGGRQLTHDFVVLDFQTKPVGTGPVPLKSSTNDAPGAIVAWVSAADGSILQVAGGWLPSAASAGKTVAN
jgi:hypothetical protein